MIGRAVSLSNAKRMFHGFPHKIDGCLKRGLNVFPFAVSAVSAAANVATCSVGVFGVNISVADLGKRRTVK